MRQKDKNSIKAYGYAIDQLEILHMNDRCNQISLSYILNWAQQEREFAILKRELRNLPKTQNRGTRNVKSTEKRNAWLSHWSM